MTKKLTPAQKRVKESVRKLHALQKAAHKASDTYHAALFYHMRRAKEGLPSDAYHQGVLDGFYKPPCTPLPKSACRAEKEQLNQGETA